MATVSSGYRQASAAGVYFGHDHCDACCARSAGLRKRELRSFQCVITWDDHVTSEGKEESETGETGESDGLRERQKERELTSVT